jgi:uncharacterized protein
MSTVEHDDSPPGWYDDPGGVAEQRYWDGRTWTDGVVVDDRIDEVPLPPEPLDPDHRADLPVVGVGWALLGAAGGLATALALGALARALTDSAATDLVVSQLALWAGMLGPIVVTSRLYGTGSVRADHQLCFRWADVGLGAALSFGARLAVSATALVALLATGADPEAFPHQFDAYDGERAALLIACVFAVTGAPIIEELFFRGLLQRSLQHGLGTVPAIVVQGLLFGAVHLLAIATWQQNVVIVVSLTTFGIISGFVAQLSKRLVPSIWMHAWFNVFAVAVLLTR